MLVSDSAILHIYPFFLVLLVPFWRVDAVVQGAYKG